MPTQWRSKPLQRLNGLRRKGKAFDNTWERSGVAYAGVPYKELFVTMTNLKNHATISLLDDWQNDYPLPGELGEQPDEWYEETGKGTAKL